MNKSDVACTAIIAVLACAACEDRLVSAKARGPAEHASASAAVSRADDDRPAEAESRRLSGLVDGFGGFEFDSAGNIEVFVTDIRNEHAVAAVRAALQPVLTQWSPGRGRHRGAQSVLVRQGEFTFEELRAWRDAASAPLLEIEGVTFTDLDEAKNRLAVGIEPSRMAAARPQAEAKLTELGIPLRAVSFEPFQGLALSPALCSFTDPACTDPCSLDPADPACSSDPCTLDPGDPSCVTDPCATGEPSCAPLQCDTTSADCSSGPRSPAEPSGEVYFSSPQTLRDRVRPLAGGTQLESTYRDRYGIERVSVCTLGFAAVYRLRRTILTNAHCTGLLNRVDSRPFWQSSEFAGTYVGVEIIDPVFGANQGGFASTPWGSCNGTVKCRRAEFALVEMSSTAVPAADFKLGYIARPLTAATGWGQSSSLQLSSPGLRINEEIGSAPLNMEVDKIGRSTGWTYGRITKRCIDTRYSSVGNDPNPTNIVLRCQHYVDGAAAQTGDSGAPVFRFKSGGYAALAGVLWGSNDAGFGFSSMDMIRLDLGVGLTDRITFQTF